MDIDTAFGGLKGSLPHDAVSRVGLHFRYGSKGDSVLVETKKTVIEGDHTCRACGQRIGEKNVRYYYWLLVNGLFHVVHTAGRPRLRDTAAIDERLFKPSANPLT